MLLAVCFIFLLTDKGFKTCVRHSSDACYSLYINSAYALLLVFISATQSMVVFRHLTYYTSKFYSLKWLIFFASPISLKQIQNQKTIFLVMNCGKGQFAMSRSGSKVLQHWSDAFFWWYCSSQCASSLVSVSKIMLEMLVWWATVAVICKERTIRPNWTRVDQKMTSEHVFKSHLKSLYIKPQIKSMNYFLHL